MLTTTSISNLADFIAHNAKNIDSLKVTSFKRYGFNEMEGYQWDIVVKLYTAPRFRDKLIKLETNDSYMEDYWETETTSDKETISALEDALADSLNEYDFEG